MKPYLYRLACSDRAGWIGDGLWGYDYAAPCDRLFASRSQAEAARDSLDAVDYLETLQEEDREGFGQPTFEVQQVATAELLFYAAQIDPDLYELERAMDLSEAPEEPDADALYALDQPEFLAWLQTLPEPVLRAAAQAETVTAVAKAAGRASAELKGASSATHTLAVVAGLHSAAATALREAIAQALPAR